MVSQGVVVSDVSTVVPPSARLVSLGARGSTSPIRVQFRLAVWLVNQTTEDSRSDSALKQENCFCSIQYRARIFRVHYFQQGIPCFLDEKQQH